MKLIENELESQYYQVVKLAEGIFAFIDTDDRKAGSNSGMADLGDKIVVFDTFYNPNASRDLRKAADILSNGRPIIVINSHNHIDHIRGNQFFDDCIIISSEDARSTMKDSIQDTLNDLAAIPDYEIEAMRKELLSETDERKKYAIAPILRCSDNLTKEPMVVVLPSLTMSDKMVIYGKSRTVELYSFELGHSKGDLMMFIPEENILFSGDLIFIDVHPWLGNGDCNMLKEIGRAINELNVKQIVPGHGPVGDKKSVEALIHYIEHIQKIADENSEAGADLESVLEEVLIAPYNGWGEKLRALDNLKVLCNKSTN